MSEPRILSDRYEVRDLLGRGGMAEVHAGLDTRLGRRVAIKLLRSDLARDPSFHERLKREAQSAAGLNHPGIVGVYDSGEETFTESGGSAVQVPFIVMEYIDGQTLRQVLSAHGHLTVREALDVTAGVLAPLEYSHRNGIVHRDIKPGNVMLTPDGDIKVMDFGIARALEDTGSLTNTQSVVGTAQYLSPEQARGEIVDARSDLYSTACLLYELLTGRPPFTGDSQLAVAYQHVGETPRPPSDFVAGIPVSVDRLVLHALQKDRDKRYQDAFTFREDVLAARDGRPLSIDGEDATRAITQAPPTVVAPLPVPMGQGAAPTGGTPTGAVASIGQDPHPATSGLSALPDAGPEEQAATRRKRGWLWAGAALMVLVLAGLGLWVYNATKPEENPPFALADLVERKADDAAQYLQEQGLQSKQQEIADDDVDSGSVVKTDPNAGTEVRRGDTVTLYVSTGPDEVKVPDTGGDTESLARQKLDDAGLKAGNNTEKNSPTVEKGNVISTKPGKGKTVKKGSNVDLVLSTGLVDVPDVTGKSGDDACKILKDDKYQLGCQVEEEETADHDAGKVFQQNIKGGGQTDQHATITVTVAKAPPTPEPTTEAPLPSATGGPLPVPSDQNNGADGDDSAPDPGNADSDSSAVDELIESLRRM